MITNKREKIIEYLENKILYYSLKSQELFEKWIRQDLAVCREQNTELLAKTILLEYRKFYSAINALLIIDIERDYSAAISERIKSYMNNYRELEDRKTIEGGLFFEMAFCAIMKCSPSKEIEEKNRYISGIQLLLCKRTIDDVFKEYELGAEI